MLSSPSLGVKKKKKSRWFPLQAGQGSSPGRCRRTELRLSPRAEPPRPVRCPPQPPPPRHVGDLRPLWWEALLPPGETRLLCVLGAPGYQREAMNTALSQHAPPRPTTPPQRWAQSGGTTRAAASVWAAGPSVREAAGAEAWGWQGCVCGCASGGMCAHA